MVPCHPPRMLSGVGWGQPCALGPLCHRLTRMGTRDVPWVLWGRNAGSPSLLLSLFLPCPYSLSLFPFSLFPRSPCPSPCPRGAPQTLHTPLTAGTFIFHISRSTFWGCRVPSQRPSPPRGVPAPLLPLGGPFSALAGCWEWVRAQVQPFPGCSICGRDRVGTSAWPRGLSPWDRSAEKGRGWEGAWG